MDGASADAAISRKLLAIAVVAVAAWVVLASLVVWLDVDLVRRQRLLQHTLEVQRELEALRAAALDVETGARGYVISGRPEFLEPFHRGLSEVPARTAQLRATLVTPANRERLETIAALAERHAEAARREVAARQAGDAAGAVAVVTSGRGKAAMDAVRDAIDALREAEDRILAARIAGAERVRRATFTAGGVVLALVVGAVVALTWFLRRDLAERAALRERVAASDRLATIGTLAAGLAHEINNPLASVLANLSFLERELADGGGDTAAADDLREALRDARLGAERVKALVQRVTELGRVAGPLRTPVDVREAVQRALDLARPSLAHAEVTVQLAACPPVLGSAPRLVQLVSSLLANAADATRGRPGAAVRVSTGVRAGEVVIAVHDAGQGIPPEVMGRIFDPFFTTKPVGAATGLGLSTADAVVREMGGRIEASSEPGLGTTVTVLLPPARARVTPEVES